MSAPFFMGAATAGAAEALGDYFGPRAYKMLKKAAGRALTGAAKRKFDQLLGEISSQGPMKYRRTQGPRLPRFRKGFERVSGFYGRFKPAFGKELKFLDSKVSTNLNANWTPGEAVSLVGRGTDPNQRIGRNFTIRSIQMRYQVIKPAGLDQASFRILIVLDRQTNGEGFTGAQLMTDGDDQNDTTWRAYRNLENISRFEILWDKTIDLNAESHDNALTTIAPTTITGTYYKKVNIKVEMSGTAGPASFTDVKDNSIQVKHCASNSPADTVLFKYTFRIRFTG